jgi:BolA protein
MSLQEQITTQLDSRFELQHLEVTNESGGHNVAPGSETHFKVVLVAPEFDGLRLLQRHRLVHETLASELAGGVHALAVHTYTGAEWQDRFGDAPMSPPCLGGSSASS